MSARTHDLELALAVAQAASERAVEARADQSYRVTAKSDGSPVTTADLRAEAEARRLIDEARPDDGFLGEESAGSLGAVNERTWVVDPIDATRNFARGIPIWATLVALIEEDRPIIGVVDAPDLGRRWWAAQGHGAFASPRTAHDEERQITVSDTADVGEAYISTTAFDTWRTHGLDAPFQELTEASYCNRGFGDFYQHCLVAEGVLDAALEPVVASWDVAALVPIVSEAGGVCTDIRGEHLPGEDTRGIVSSTRALHPRILEVFHGSDHR